MASKQNIDDAAVRYMRDKRQYRNDRVYLTGHHERVQKYFLLSATGTFCHGEEFSNMEEIYMNINSNKPNLDLRTTPYARHSSWSVSIAILAVFAVAALAWNFWPYANSHYASTKESRIPAGQKTMTQPPATATPSATAPAQQ